MFQLFETLCLKDGELLHLQYHENRLNRSRKELFRDLNPIDLCHALKIPSHCSQGLWRCRVVYGETIATIEFVRYAPKKIESLTCVHDDTIEYQHKFVDRTALNRMLSQVNTDDILIIRRGMVTDTSCGNIAFFDGFKWVTPTFPLLSGTTRARLIEAGFLIEDEIALQDLPYFKKAVIFNAMTGFDPKLSIPMSHNFLRTERENSPKVVIRCSNSSAGSPL